MDILVGWHIDHTQRQSLTQQVSGKTCYIISISILIVLKFEADLSLCVF